LNLIVLLDASRMRKKIIYVSYQFT